MEAHAKLVNIDIAEGIAVITMDDGQNNLISPSMIADINAALDEAERANAVVVLTGRAQVLSAGFDLKILRSGVLNTFKMLIGGFALAGRLFRHPTPVVVACNGHAVAMGSFLLLSGDYRIGVEGDFKIQANEVEIGLTVPYTAIELCRHRLKPGHFDRALLLSEPHTPDEALNAGFLDSVVKADVLMSQAMAKAQQYASLDLNAHKGTKLRVRAEAIKALKYALLADKIDFVKLGIKRALGR